MNADEKKKNIARRAERILDIAKVMASSLGCQVENRIEEIQLHYEGYAEPGCDTEFGLVATGNWNTIDTYDHSTRSHTVVSNLPKRIADLFERMGIECEWSDEWTECGSCYKLVRTNPDSYGWTQSFYFDENNGDCTCVECLKDDAENYLSGLEGNSNVANTMDEINPSDYGYIQVNEDSYQTGFHPGQNDDPHKIAKELDSKGITRYLFNIDSVGQFDSNWSVYVHSSEEHLLNPCDCEDCDGDCDNCNDSDDCDDCDCANDCEWCEASDKKESAQVVVNTNDHPCKHCGTGLNAGETPCWKCGIDNPTRN